MNDATESQAAQESQVQITVRINGRDYTLACVPGQEARIESLAARIDGMAKRVPGAANSLNDARVLVLAALYLADQLDTLEQKKAEATTAASTPKASAPATSGTITNGGGDGLAGHIESIAMRVENIANQIASRQ